MIMTMKCLFVCVLLFNFCCGAVGTVLFNVKMRNNEHPININYMRNNDAKRHARLLSSVDLSIGGALIMGHVGLYYAEIGIGIPEKKYYVQVDTGSNSLWLNCIPCTGCPTKSNLGIELSSYDPNGSRSGKTVMCNDRFCKTVHGSSVQTCLPNNPCDYNMSYGDGTFSAGHYVSDTLHYDQVAGDLVIEHVNATIKFGCGTQQGGSWNSPIGAIDGIIGFGKYNESVLFQLAALGKVKRIFSHCLDRVVGGGIFVIGEVVEPKMNRTPLIPGPYYNVNMTWIDVTGSKIRIPRQFSAFVDSGTTLVYLPEAIYSAVTNKVFEKHDIKLDQDMIHFPYSGSLDNDFPLVIFVFENSLSLNVYPHEYLLEYKGEYYFGFIKDSKGSTIILGDIVLANRLVMYDVENHVIGWTEYNCSSTIKIQDDMTGSIHVVNAHQLGSKSLFPYSLSLSKFRWYVIHVMFVIILVYGSFVIYKKNRQRYRDQRMSNIPKDHHGS